MAKKYAVVLAQEVEKFFPPEFALFLHSSNGLHYFLANKIETEGSFFYMELDLPSTNISTDLQLHIPHGYIRYVIAAKDIKTLGFI